MGHLLPGKVQPVRSTITESFNQIAAGLPPGVVFNPPAANGIVGTIHSPEWTEFNLSVQQELNRSTVFIMNYVGNHGARISYSTAWPNAWDGTGGIYNGQVPITFTNPYGYAPGNNYGTVTEYRSGAVSNYNGLTFSLRKQFSSWVSAHVNYTWSHNIDETSNGGLFNYGFEGNNTILGQESLQSACAQTTTATPITMSVTWSTQTLWFNPEHSIKTGG